LQIMKKLATNSLSLRKNRICQRSKKIPYVFLEDETFALSKNLTKPFSDIHHKRSAERIFTYQLSRVVENVFDICSAMFRVLRKPIILESEKVKLVIMKILCLHNFLRKSKTFHDIYTPPIRFDSIPMWKPPEV